MVLPKLRQIKGVGPKRYEKITAKMQEKEISIVDVYAMAAADLKKEFSIPINVARAIEEVGKGQASEKQNATSKPQKSKNIPSVHIALSKEVATLVQKDDQAYPQQLLTRLGDKAPEYLYMWGNFELLKHPSVGFCGSRNVTNTGLAVTQDVTEQISALGWVTVSGHARGVDATAHRTALENDAGTIVVLPQGIEGFKLRTELRKNAKVKNLLIISEFEAGTGWAVGRAMQRNSTIIGLSDAMVLVESRAKGGTFAAGKTTLRLNHPLYVVRFANTSNSNEGNDYFIQQGAKELFKSRKRNRANITSLQAEVEAQHQPDEMPDPPTEDEAVQPKQLPLINGLEN